MKRGASQIPPYSLAATLHACIRACVVGEYQHEYLVCPAKHLRRTKADGNGMRIPDRHAYTERPWEGKHRMTAEYSKQHWRFWQKLPPALARKLNGAQKKWIWQFVFPATRLSTDPRSGKTRRHHIHETSLQKAIRNSARAAGIHKRVTSHTMRHSFAGVRKGYPLGSGIARTCGCQHHHDLYACDKKGRSGSAKSF